MPSLRPVRRPLSLAAAVAAMLAAGHSASAQTGAFTFSGNLGNTDQDALVGLSTTKTYVGNYSFGIGAAAPTINGVAFTSVPGTNPGVPGVFSTTGLVQQHAGAGAVPGGQMGVLVNSFAYGSGTTPEVFTFNNLTVGQTYVVSFYNKVWDAGARVQTLTAGNASTGTLATYDQNTSGVVGNLNILRYTFQAATPTQTVSFVAVNAANTNHQYGLSLEQTFNNTWTAGNTWTTSTWTGGAATAPNSAGSNANFPAQAAPTTIDLDAPRTVGHIQFDGANAWTIDSTTAQTLTLQADVGGASTLSALSGSHVITPDITLASPTLLKVGAGAITLSGDITGGTGTVQVGAGTLALTGTNTYTGETIIGGTLEVNTVSDYGVPSAIGSRALSDENATINGVGLRFQGGTLKFTGSTAQSTNRNIRIQTAGATIDASGTTPAATLSFTKTGANVNLFETPGARTLTLTGTNTGDNSFSIPLTNEGASPTSITKSGTGTWVLAGPDGNSASGTVTVNGGTLKLGKTNAVAVSGNVALGNGSAPAVVQITGTGGNQIADGATVTLAGTGANAGVLRLNGNNETIAGLVGDGFVENEFGSVNTATLTVNGGGTYAYSGILRDGDGAGTDGTLAFTKSGTGSQTLSGANTYSGTTTVNGGTLIVANGSALGSTAGGTAVSGAAELRITGGITIGAEPISIAGGGIGDQGVLRNISGDNFYGGTLTLTGQSRVVSNAGTLTFTNASSVGGTTNLIMSGAGNIVFNGAISGGFLTKDNLIEGGTGTITLAGNNTYTGATTVSAGTLIISGTPAGAGGHIVSGGGTLRYDYSTNDTSKIADAAGLSLNGGTLELTGGSHLEVVNTVAMADSAVNNLNRTGGTATIELNNVTAGFGATLTIGGDNIATTNNRNVNGLLPNFRVGNSWAVNATDSDDGFVVAYTGYTDVNRLGGTIPNNPAANVRIVEAGTTGNITLGAGPNAINSLQIGDTTDVATIAPAASGDVLSVGGQAAATIWQQATGAGLVIGATPGDGILTTGGTADATADTLTISNDSTSSALTINSSLANNGTDNVNVVKNGPGTVVFAGNNTNQGTITASNGTLILSGNNSGRPTSLVNGTLVLNGATLQLQANAGNTSAGVSTALSAERVGNQPLVVRSGGTLQLRSDTSVLFAGANEFGGLGSATITIDVNALTTGTNQTLSMAPAGFNVNTTTINVTGGNGYTLALGKINNVANNATLTLNPTTANASVNGYSAGGGLSTTLALSGSSSANFVTGAVTNPGGSGATNVLKIGTSTWTLNGADNYTGNVTVSNGTLNLNGAKTGTVGTVNVANVAGTNATLGIGGGTIALGGSNFFVGNVAAGTPVTGTVNQTGGAVTSTGGNALLLGNGGIANTAIYNMSGGTIATHASGNRGIILGVNSNAIATFNLSGTGALNMTAATGSGESALQIGRFDDNASTTHTATFNQTGGTANIGILSIGGNGVAGSNSTLTLDLTGGTFSANQFPRLSQGNGNTSRINIGGTANVTLPAFPTARGTGSTAVVTFDGGTLQPAAASATFMGGLNSATIKAGGAKFLVPTGRDITVTQALLADTVSTGGGLTKDGPGALTLTASSTYVGGTDVDAGTLFVNGNIAGSTTTVEANATLGGTGTVGPVLVNAGGIVAPGVTVGTLTTGAFSLSSSAVLKLDLATAGVVGGTNDLLSIGGALTLDGTLQVNALAGFGNGTYRLANYSGALTDNGLSLEPAFLTAFPGSFIDVSTANQVDLVVVPEPTAAISLLGGLGLLAGLRRRRTAR